MDRLIREWQRFRQVLRSFVTFVVVVLAFACISFLSVLRSWFPVTSSFGTVSSKAENIQSSTSNEEISPSMEPEFIPRTLNWQRIRHYLGSYATFAALSTIVAFFCSIFAVSDAFNSIRRPICNAAFQKNSSTSTPKNESSPKIEGPTRRNMCSPRLQGPMPRNPRLPRLEDPTPGNESLPQMEGPTQRNDSMPEFQCPKPRIESCLELEGLALRVGESCAGIQMIPSGNLRKSPPSKRYKNVSHILELQQSDNRSSPQKRKGNESDIEDRILSENISNHEANQRKSTGDGRKKFRSSKEVTNDSAAKGLLSVECGTNLNEYSTVYTSQEDNPQRLVPIIVSDISQRKSGEESCQEGSLGQRSPAVFHRINEGAGPSSQPDSVLYHENSQKQNTPKLPKESLNVLIKMKDSSDSPITHTSSSSISSNIPPGGSCAIIIEAGSSQIFSDDIGQQQVEQSTEEQQHELALLQESLTSIPWSYIFSSPCKPSQARSNHQTPRTLGFSYVFSDAQSSLPSQQENIRARGLPYRSSRTNLHANQSKISQEGSIGENECHQKSSYAVSSSREPLTPRKTSSVGSRYERLRTQDSPKSPEASTDSCLDKFLPDESQHESNNVPRPSSQIRGMDISEHLVNEDTDGSRREILQLQESLVENTGGHDSSKRRKISPRTSQHESMIMQNPSYAHKRPNKGFYEITAKDSRDVQSVEVPQVNTDRSTKDQSNENSKDGQHSVAEKSFIEGTKNNKILHSAEISREEDTITKNAGNNIEIPKLPAIEVNVMLPDDKEENEKVQIDHRDETNTSDKILKGSREVSQPEIEVKLDFLTEKSTESLDESFGEPDLAEGSNMAGISHEILPISSSPPKTTLPGTLSETLVLEETSTITKDNDNTKFSDTSYCEFSVKREVESSIEEDNGTAGKSTLDSRPPDRMQKTDDYGKSMDF